MGQASPCLSSFGGLLFSAGTLQAGYLPSLSLSVTICRMSRWGQMFSELPGVECRSLTWEQEGLWSFTLICNATLWLSTRTALGTSGRLCDDLNTAAGSAGDQGQGVLSLPSPGDWVQWMGYGGFLSSPSLRDLGSFFQLRNTKSIPLKHSLGCPGGLENMSAPSLHTSMPFLMSAGRW